MSRREGEGVSERFSQAQRDPQAFGRGASGEASAVYRDSMAYSASKAYPNAYHLEGRGVESEATQPLTASANKLAVLPRAVVWAWEGASARALSLAPS